MSRFYIKPEFIKGDKIYIKGKELHHICDVMRLGVGDIISAFDGTGVVYAGKIESVSLKEAVVGIDKTCNTPGKLPKITLAVSVPKLDKMDLIVQKATELGVHTIYPVLTKRTVISLDERKANLRLERWRNIAIEASKQCGRSELPRVEPPMKFEEALQSVKNYEIALMPTLEGDVVPLKKILNAKTYKNAILFIGPEGDFTPQELSTAKKLGCVAVSLGPLVYRVETASLAALAILFYALGN
ncbi:MAG: 16S rRNA (uracil(1498)-N(3))-methyltransferase [Candidatus Omnitrophota bacterium]